MEQVSVGNCWHLHDIDMIAMVGVLLSEAFCFFIIIYLYCDTSDT